MALTRWEDRQFPTASDFWDSLMGKDFFDRSNFSPTGTTLPSVNIRDENDKYLVEVAAPGMKKDDFNIELEDDTLTISSEREDKNEENEQNYSRKEFSYQSFRRTFNLPKTVESEKIRATYQDGVLRINIPKKQEARKKAPRQIKIS